ncbi:metallophosphoesterase [bacterium]|nr:metallophosphoesterase [bacterium]RQV96622.1 MAG: serine/threonine protein phosphatase [bacterium]
MKQKKTLFILLLISVSLVFSCISFFHGQDTKTGFALPALENSNSWTMVLIPDPQTYMKFKRNQVIFHSMMQWIKMQKENLNIGLVLCVGDLVEQNALDKPDGINGDQTGTEQWKASKAAFRQLDGVLPYILCTGNHDYGISNSETRETQFPDYFNVTDNSLVDPVKNGILKGMCKNAQGNRTLENAYYEFISPLGRKFLIFSLEWSPRNEVVFWADSIANMKKYEDHIATLLTHSYLDSDNERLLTNPYPKYLNALDTNSGEDLWFKLIKPNGIFQFVVAGHVANSDDHAGQVGFRTDKNIAGKDVHQMLFNAQREGGGWHGNGGDGWLRLLEFSADGTVHVQTFSPYLWSKEETRDRAWRKMEIDDFTFRLSF